jgi:O-antigen/teichoic acid export membrane protein
MAAYQSAAIKKTMVGLSSGRGYIVLSMKRQFAKNLSSNWAVYATSAIISFFLMPYILGKIGQAALGVWILVGSFSGYLGLFDFGIGFAVVRFVARFQKTGESEKRNEIIATAFYLACFLSLLVLGATIYIMFNAADFFDIPADLVWSSQAVIFLIGLSIAIGFPLSIFSEALAGGLWRYDLFNKVSLLMALLRTGLTILFLELGWGLAGLGLAALIGSLLGYLWRMRTLFRLLPDLSVRPRLAGWKVIRMIGDYSFYSFLLVLSGRIAFYSDSFIVGFFRGVEDVAIFGIAAKLTEYLRQLIFTMTRLFSPVASRYDPDTDKASLRRIFYDGSRLHLLFSLPLSLILFFWGGRLINLWVGDAFDHSQIILQVLLIGHIVSFLQGIGGEIMLGVGRHRIFAILSFLAATANIFLSIFLIQKYGLVGVAWGTTIPLAALSVLYLPAATFRLVGGSLVGFAREVIRPVLFANALSAVLIIYASDRIGSLAQTALWALITGLIYSLSAYFFGLKAAEKAKIAEEWRKMISRF